MKKINKKLNLTRETINHLTTRELGDVAGGGTNLCAQTQITCPPTAAPSCAPSCAKC